MKIGFNSSLKFAHVLLSKGEQSDFVYKSFNFYAGLLVANDKTRIAIESAENLIKSVENYEKDKSEIVNLYVIKILCMIINEEDEKIIEESFSKAQDYAVERDDSNRLKALESIKVAVNKGDLSLFNSNVYEVTHSLDNEIVKKLRSAYEKAEAERKENKENNKDDTKEKEEEEYL